MKQPNKHLSKAAIVGKTARQLSALCAVKTGVKHFQVIPWQDVCKFLVGALFVNAGILFYLYWPALRCCSWARALSKRLKSAVGAPLSMQAQFILSGLSFLIPQPKR